MSQQLLLAACQQAERSEPAVRAAALMHIARVLARSDQVAAEQLLERGINLAKEVNGDAASLLLQNAIYLAAAVSPKHAVPLYAEYRRPDRFGSAVIGLVNTMAEHGHASDAIDYLKNPLPGDRFPLHFVGNLERECRDDETRLRLLRAAIQAWEKRDPVRPDSRERFTGLAFIIFFGRYWNLLSPQVVAPVLEELVEYASGMESEPRRFPLTENPEDPELTSQKEYLLFQLIPALQSLKPALAQSVLENPRVAAAAKRFPLGMQSVYEGQRKYNPACDDVMVIGRRLVIPMTEALANDFEAAFQEAHKKFAKDTDSDNPNKAPKECWPSAWEFRNILFKAGQHQGAAADKYLQRIPDEDLRLFAQIELCAAIAGLHQIAGSTVWQPSRRKMPSPVELDQVLGPPLGGIRCPKCEWMPRTKNLWSCQCGHRWNTFESRGLCPACQHQWEATQCPQCGAKSPHTEWYVDPRQIGPSR